MRISEIGVSHGNIFVKVSHENFETGGFFQAESSQHPVLVNHIAAWTDIKSVVIICENALNTELVVNPTNYDRNRLEKTLIFEVPAGQRLIGFHGLYSKNTNSNRKLITQIGL